MGHEHREHEGQVSELVEVTPEAYRCGGVGTACPAIFETEPEKLVIIGKIVNHEALQGRVGPDETAVEISRDLIAGLFVPE